MNPTTVIAVAGIARHLLTIVGGALLGGADVFNDQTADTIVGAVSSLVGVGWSLWAKLSTKAPAAVVPAPGVGK